MFSWGLTQQKEFKRLLHNVSCVPIYALPNYDKTSELKCDASGICAILMQDKNVIAYLSEDLNNAYHDYSTYDLELYDDVLKFESWQPYLLAKGVLNHHKPLSYFNHLSKRHSERIVFMKTFPYVIKYTK